MEMMMNWKTIDTAPRDGTQIIGFDAKYGTGHCICWFNLRDENKNEDWEWLTGIGSSVHVDFWAPLPEAPNA